MAFIPSQKTCCSIYHYRGALCTGEVAIVTKNGISGDPKREAFMDEGEFAEQAFEVQVTSKVNNKDNNLVNIDLTTNVHNKIPLSF